LRIAGKITHQGFRARGQPKQKGLPKSHFKVNPILMSGFEQSLPDLIEITSEVGLARATMPALDRRGRRPVFGTFENDA
jgi:hypothetical protein